MATHLDLPGEDFCKKCQVDTCLCLRAQNMLDVSLETRGSSLGDADLPVFQSMTDRVAPAQARLQVRESLVTKPLTALETITETRTEIKGVVARPTQWQEEVETEQSSEDSREAFPGEKEPF